MPTSPRVQRLYAVFGAVSICVFLLACNATANLAPNPSALSETMPRWACPSVTPVPYGPDGPAKRVWDDTTTNPDGTTSTTHHREDYVIWEQEYGGISNPPPPPTPYTKSGDRYYFGQLVNFANGALDVTVAADATDVITAGKRLYNVDLQFHNYGDALPFAPVRQVAVSRIARPDGRQVSGSWVVDDATLKTLPESTQDHIITGTIKTGDSRFTIPIYAPDGKIQAADLQLDVKGAAAESTQTLRISFIPGHDNDCGHAGTRQAVYPKGPTPIIGVAAPPGTDGIVAFAMSQVGRQYCWGGKGWSKCSGCDAGSGCVTPACASYPCWDCSGLSWGSYNSVGVTIGQGTSNQQNYPEVSQDQVQPGDLLLFGGINQHGRGGFITHVGVYAGDVDGDGKGDLVHAANYPDGVVLTKNVFGNPWYRSHLALITRPPRGASR